jgi:flagellar biogenesis protein FliO
MNQLTADSAVLPAAVDQKPLLAVLRDLATRFIAFLRSTRIQRRERRMQLMERIAVGNKQHVVLLKVDGREIVVGCSADSLVLLGQSELKQAAAQQVTLSANEIQSKFDPPAAERAPRPRRKPQRKAEPQKREDRKAASQTESRLLAGPAVAEPAHLETERLPKLVSPARTKKAGRPKLMKPAARKQRQTVSHDAGLLNSIYGKAWIYGTDRRVQ